MIDPNIVYVVLVFGLWVTVTAAYVPGTGLIEGLAMAALVAGVLILVNMPTNWAGVLVMVIGGVAFLLIPFLNQRWARVAELGLVLQVIGAATLFHGLQVSWLLIVVTIAISVAYHRLVLLPVLERARKQAVVIDDDAQLVGTVGRVVKASEKVGTTHIGSINVKGEQWTATSDYPLKPGEEVVVLERDGLQLYVEGVKHKQG
ncbi:MAG: NfeD family protein [Anaerolineae bacterium]